MRKILSLLVGLFMVLFISIAVIAEGPDMNEYAAILQGKMDAIISSPEILSGWKDGIKRDYNAKLIKLTTAVTPLEIDVNEGGDVILLFRVDNTAICKRDGSQIKVVCSSIWVCLFKNKIPTKTMMLENLGRSVVAGIDI